MLRAWLTLTSDVRRCRALSRGSGVGNREEIPCQAEPQVREVVTWELAQKYFLDPTFGGALVPGQRNVFTTTADFTGIAFLTEARRLSPLISRLKFQATSRTEAEWDIDYDFKQSRINASTAFVNYRFGPYTIGGGDAYLLAPSDTPTPTGQQAFNQFRVSSGLRTTQQARLQWSDQPGVRRQSGFSAVCGGADRLQLGLLRIQRRVSPLCPGIGPQRKSVPLQFCTGQYRLNRKSPPPGKAVLKMWARAPSLVQGAALNRMPGGQLRNRWSPTIQ